MIFNENMEMVFQDLPEMYYNIWNIIGLSINKDNYLFDPDTGIVLRYADKYIKTSNRPRELYAGKTDIVFEPMKNYNLMLCIFGYYLEKEFIDRPHYIIAQMVEDNEDRTKQKVTVRTQDGDISSPFYNNVYLGFCWCIFALDGNRVNLDNFDIII